MIDKFFRRKKNGKSHCCCNSFIYNSRIGRIYAGDMKKGIFFLIIIAIFYSIGYFIDGIYLIISIVADVIYCLFAAYDAYKLAQ